MEFIKYNYWIGYIQLCKHFWYFPVKAGIYAGTEGACRSCQNGWGQSFQDFVGDYLSNDKISVYYLWINELYFNIQQLYVAVFDYK